jgi:hypothetical protein
MNKTLLLERLQNERDQFELLLNRIGFARQLTIKGVAGGLTIKDLLADVLSREQFLADRMMEILHGETYAPGASFTALEYFQAKYGYPDYESPLAEKEKPDHLVLEKFKNIALEEIVSQELAAYSNILTAAERLTHHQYLDHDLFHRIAEHTYRPYRRMGSAIRRWLKKTAHRSN